MLVFLKFLAGKSCTLDVEPSDTIEAVKRKILEQEGIEVDHQRLFFHGQPLDEDERLTLAHYEVRNESALHVVVGPRRCSGRMRIHVETAAGKTLALDVNATDTLASVKDQVKAADRDVASYDEGELVLLFVGSQRLADERTLADYNVPAEATLRLRPKMTIYVRMLTCKSVNIDVQPSDTIECVKYGVMAKEGIPPAQQRIIYRGRPLEDDRTLAEFDIQNESILHLVIRLRGPLPDIANP
jgi:ubiquitin C